MKQNQPKNRRLSLICQKKLLIMEVLFLYLQELIGHKNMPTTDIYLDVFLQDKIDEYHRKVIDSVL